MPTLSASVSLKAVLVELQRLRVLGDRPYDIVRGAIRNLRLHLEPHLDVCALEGTSAGNLSRPTAPPLRIGAAARRPVLSPWRAGLPTTAAA